MHHPCWTFSLGFVPLIFSQTLLLFTVPGKNTGLSFDSKTHSQFWFGTSSRFLLALETPTGPENCGNPAKKNRHGSWLATEPSDVTEILICCYWTKLLSLLNCTRALQLWYLCKFFFSWWHQQPRMHAGFKEVSKCSDAHSQQEQNKTLDSWPKGQFIHNIASLPSVRGWLFC